MRDDTTGSDGVKDLLTGGLAASRRIVRLIGPGDDDASPDASDPVDEPVMDRRTYLQAAGGLAALGVGDDVRDAAFAGSGSAPLASVDEPTVYGYGGATALTDGGTTLAHAGDGGSGARYAQAPEISPGNRVHAELASGSADWYVVDADRSDPIRLSFDRADPVRPTALFLYGPDGSVSATASAEGDRRDVRLGVADRSGPHFLQAVDLAGGDGAYSFSVHTGEETVEADALASTVTEQAPYDGTPQTVPGTIQAQRYDEGGEGVAYHDTTDANLGGAFRPEEAVDVESTRDASGEYNVGWTAADEWLEYTVDVTPGTYTLRARVASTDSGTFEVSLDGTSLGTVEVPDTGGWQSWQTVTIDDVSVDVDGRAILRVDALTDGFNLNYLRFAGQRPYGGTPQTVPGTIQAQRYDEGGEGVAYHDTTDANLGGAFRPEEAVDVESTRNASGEYNVGWTGGGEWLEYTVDASAGTYALEARVASRGGGRFEVSLDGSSLGTVEVPDTGGWQSWQTVTIDDVSVAADGQAVLRVDALTDGFNLNYLRFAGQRPYGGTPQTIPGTVQAEKFDEGGEGIAFSDTTGANLGGAFRPEDAVDVEASADGTNEFNVGWTASGEWLEYTVDASAGTYALEARVASRGGGRFEVSLDGTSLGTVEVPDTGGWQSWQTVTIDDVSVETSGQAVLRLDALTDGFNLNWVAFRSTSDAADDYGVQTYGQYGYGGA